jgi:hypothetical protein
LDSLHQQAIAKLDRLFPSVESTKSTYRKTNSYSHGIKKKQCAHCGKEVNEVSLIKHSIIPNDISQKLRLSNVRVLDLCFECHKAIHDWNARHISWVMLDETKRVKVKPLVEVAKEYEFAYQEF